jgi:putative ABC transport system substrate-binding protein
VFALGSRAAGLANAELSDLPLVFAMVDNWQGQGLARAGAAGVSPDIPIDALFTRYKLMLPRLRRIGIICSDQTPRNYLALARTAARRLDLSLRVVTVASDGDVSRAYRTLRGDIDALWMIPDTRVATPSNFALLAQRTRQDEIAFLAFSESSVQAGALLAVTPSYTTMGSQAAALLDQLLRDAVRVRGTIVQTPFGTRSVVNAATARALGLPIDAALLSMADVIIDPPGSDGGR